MFESLLNAIAGAGSAAHDHAARQDHHDGFFMNASQAADMAARYQVLPLDDPDNADKRRASVGLPPLAEYLSYWNMKWDTAQYKKDRQALDTLYRIKTR